MAVPRNRHSNKRKNTKRSHHAKVPVVTSACTNCGKPVLPHRLCIHCGHYKNQPVLKQKEAEE